MSSVSLHQLIGEASSKYFGKRGSKEAPQGSAQIETNRIRPFIDCLSTIDTDIMHVIVGSRTPKKAGIDNLGDVVRGDHYSLSALFTSSNDLRIIGNNWQDIANMGVEGKYKGITHKKVKGMRAKDLNSVRIFSLITKGGSVQENSGYFRHAGDKGSAYFSISFTKELPKKEEWEKIKNLIRHILESKNQKNRYRGAFINFKGGKVPLAFKINDGHINTVEDRETNNRRPSAEEFIENLEQVFAANDTTSFYLAGSFDI